MPSGPDTRPSARASVVRVALASCIGIVLLSCGEGAAPTAAPPATPPAPPPPVPQPLNPPANLRVSAAGEDFVEWSWNAVPGAIGYVVQVSADETFDDSDPIHVTVETTFTATDLPPETSVYVRVAAASGTAEAPLVGAWTSQVAGMTLPPAIPVTIPDPGLRAAVTAALGKRAGDPVTRRDLSTLGRLEARSAQIVDLTGLEWATGLQVLQLEANNISDVSPLAGLTGLADLSLWNNSVSDLSALAKLTELERLALNYNNISDISPLGGLTRLEQLHLSHNNISDISPLAGLTRLELLSLQFNRISGISPLARLTGLKWLYLGRSDISDISPLARLTGLIQLFLFQANISDISALAGLTGLLDLSLSDNSISDISALAGLTGLADLGLSSNDISDISPLARLTELAELRLANNDISDISPLAGLSGLRHLDLTSNNVADLTPIAHLPWREGDVLYAGNNPLRRASLDLLLRLADAGVAVDYDLALEDEFPGSQLVRLIGDNSLVMSVPEDLTEKNVHNGLPLEDYAREIYRWFADEFDYLIFLSNLSSIEDFNGRVYYGVYRPVMNDTEGTGRNIFFDSGPGSAGKLRGMIHFPYRAGLWRGPGLHELMHSWANYAVPTAVGGHWGFSSANGQLGGFNRDNLVELGGGRYSAGRFGTFANGGNGVPYSPIELYFAGLIPPGEVPDLWVAVDGERADDGSFTASDVRDYSIEDIVAEHGRRVPASSTAQRHFRAMVVLLMNDGSISLMQAEQLSEQVSAFSHPGDDDEFLYNYYEATGGRGTIAMDGLSRVRKSRPSLLRTLPPSFGRIPPPHICWPDGRGGIRHQLIFRPPASPSEQPARRPGVSSWER